MLTNGTLIVPFARDRDHLVLWVMLFLALTWTSTLHFVQAAAGVDAGEPATLLHDAASHSRTERSR